MFELNLSVSITMDQMSKSLLSDFFCSISSSIFMEAEINQILNLEYWQKFTTSFINDESFHPPDPIKNAQDT